MKRFAACMILMPSIAFGLGDTGHRVVCQIAFDELTVTARAEVERLLDLDADYATFADSCLFAEHPKRIRTPDHFINLPRSLEEISTDDCPMADSCLLPAIRMDTNVLMDPVSSDTDKLMALKLLGHWLGDIHAPLHVAYLDDLGANRIDVDAAIPDANLHEVWDYQIIASTLGDDYAEVAAQLRATISNRQRAAWQNDSPVKWANESYQVTISPSVQYCVRKQDGCWYSSDNMILDKGESQRLVTITDEYVNKHGPIVARRLQQAGVRLAELLDRAFQITAETPGNQRSQ